jgi:guanosine-3',5'-bis(diphosphate) 3'-pyrophosphohydrolase
LGIIHSLYKPIHEKFKDYIAVPKFNGYQSLHTVLFGPHGAPIEIQIRTQDMDQMAISGIASHWAYKSGEDAINTAQLIAEHWISTILDAQNHSINSVEFFESIKMELYPDKVFIFTPKGTIMELPRGSTAVDFAYAVHTDIGNSCVAVRINRVFLPLSTQLTNGQTVSIITTKEAEPDPNWLTFAVTTKARNCIRNHLRNKKQSKLIALGKQLLDNAFAEISFDQKKIHEETFTTFIKKSNLDDINSLYENIGLGNHLAILVAYQLINSNGDSGNALEKNETKIMYITGSQGMAVSFANCCYPIPGDPIIGYLNNIYGVDVHTEDCIHLKKFCSHPERRLKIAWAHDVTGNFHVAVSIEVVNRIGAIAEVTQAISKANAKIDSIHCDANSGGYSMLNVNLLVKNRTHLQRVKRHISRVPAVIGVVRKIAEKG